jgi:Zn-dependent peptidase ImmA (M78 family)
MIVQSFRHLSDDHFWFTFFHEIGHLVLHGHEATFVDSKRSSECSLEAEANEFAANVLIPLQRHDELVSLRPRMESIVRFAVSIGIAPGIVVGQMQHLRVIGPHQLNFLKRQYDWSEIAAALN